MVPDKNSTAHIEQAFYITVAIEIREKVTNKKLRLDLGGTDSAIVPGKLSLHTKSSRAVFRWMVTKS